MTGLDNAVEQIEAITVWWESIGIKVNRKPADVVEVVLPLTYKHDFTLPTVSGILSGFQFPVSAGSPTGIKGSIGRATEDADIDQATKDLVTVKTQDEYITVVRKISDLSIARWTEIPIYYFGDTYAIKAGLGGDKWNIGKKGISLNLNALLTGKGNS